MSLTRPLFFIGLARARLLVKHSKRRGGVGVEGRWFGGGHVLLRHGNNKYIIPANIEVFLLCYFVELLYLYSSLGIRIGIILTTTTTIIIIIITIIIMMTIITTRTLAA